MTLFQRVSWRAAATLRAAISLRAAVELIRAFNPRNVHAARRDGTVYTDTAANCAHAERKYCRFLGVDILDVVLR